MAEKKGKRTKSAEKGYRFSGVLDFFKSSAESKPKSKKGFYRHSPAIHNSPVHGRGTPATPGYGVDRGLRNREGVLSPTRSRSPTDHRYRHSDMEMRFERAGFYSHMQQPLRRLAKTGKRPAFGSQERLIQSPASRPPFSPPSDGVRNAGIKKNDERIPLQTANIEVKAASPRHSLVGGHKGFTPKRGSTSKPPAGIIQSPASWSPTSPSHAGQSRPDEVIPGIQSGQHLTRGGVEATAASPGHVHKCSTSKGGSTPKSPGEVIQSPAGKSHVSPSPAGQRSPGGAIRLLQRGQHMELAEFKGVVDDHKGATPKGASTPQSPEKFHPPLKRGQQHAGIEAIAGAPAHSPVYDHLRELQNIHPLEEHQKQQSWDLEVPFFVVCLLLLATVTGLLVGYAMSDSHRETTTTEYYEEDYYGGNEPYISGARGLKSSPSPRAATARHNTATHVCVYHGRHEGLTYELNGMAYSAATMPLDSCNLVLYCCAQLGDGYSPVQQAGDLGNFKKLWNVTANLRPWQHLVLIVGDGIDDRLGRFRDILKDRHAIQTFVRVAAEWCRRQGYSGVYLQWPHVAEFTWNEVVPVMVQLRKLFATRSLTLGTVVPEEDVESNWRLLYQLAALLGEASIILKPPTYTVEDFTGQTFSYYTRRQLNTLNATAQKMGPRQRSLCVMAPAAAIAFTVSRSSVVPNDFDHLPALGPAISTGHSPVGHRSYTEACAAIANMTVRVTTHSVLAVGNGLWLSFPTPDSLGGFLKEVSAFDYTCGGIWDSYGDDFTGRCGGQAYPLMAACKAEFFEPPGGVTMQQP